MERQPTATVYIIQDQQVLLILHKKFNKWLPPGGHLEPNELPHEGARREVMEETGLEIEWIKQENIEVDRWNAKSIPRPYMCLLEEIPAYGTAKAHQHADSIFLARPKKDTQMLGGCEVAKWWSWDELEKLKGDVEIYEETREVIQHLLCVYEGCST